jgi:hypothetical protein
MAKDGFKQIVEHEVNKRIKAAVWQQYRDEFYFCVDMMQIALGRLGYGPKRLSAFKDQFERAYDEYNALRTQEHDEDFKNKTDKKAPEFFEVGFKGAVDNELKQYCGKFFVDYDTRHNEVITQELRKIAYK